jgi:hypothetical protein
MDMDKILEKIESNWFSKAKSADKKVSSVYENLDRIENQVKIIRKSMDRQRRYPGRKDTIAGVEDSGSNAMMMIEFAKDVLKDIVEINKYNVESR